jgi:mannose-6-phosphate isomerase-like protein (cupin superfamily)
VNELLLVAPGGGEVVGDSPDRRVEILSDHPTLHATWSRFGPWREGADLHVHRRHTDLFYILEGELTVMLGSEGEPVVVPAGTLARVPRLVVHGFRNGSDGEVRYLNLHAPGQRFGDFLRALRDGRTFSYDQHPPPPDGGGPPTDAVLGGSRLVADRRSQRMALLADVDEIAIAEVRSDPAPPHIHHRHVESVYVLDGELTFAAEAASFGRRRARGCKCRRECRTGMRSRATAPCASSSSIRRTAVTGAFSAHCSRRATTKSWPRCGRHSIKCPRRPSPLELVASPGHSAGR